MQPYHLGTETDFVTPTIDGEKLHWWFGLNHASEALIMSAVWKLHLKFYRLIAFCLSFCFCKHCVYLNGIWAADWNKFVFDHVVMEGPLFQHFKYCSLVSFPDIGFSLFFLVECIWENQSFFFSGTFDCIKSLLFFSAFSREAVLH